MLAAVINKVVGGVLACRGICFNYMSFSILILSQHYPRKSAEISLQNLQVYAAKWAVFAVMICGRMLIHFYAVVEP